MIRMLSADGPNQMVFRAAIHLGYQVCTALEFDGLRVAETLQEKCAYFPHHRYQKVQDSHL